MSQQLALSYERKRIILDETEITRGLVGKYVEVYAFADGRIDVRSKDVSLAYRTFDKNQRVTHTAIVENKRLSDVLTWIEVRQDETRAFPSKPQAKLPDTRRARKKNPARDSPSSNEPSQPRPLIPPRLSGLLRYMRSTQPRQRRHRTCDISNLQPAVTFQIGCNSMMAVCSRRPLKRLGRSEISCRA